MAFNKSLEQDKVMVGCKISFTRYFYDNNAVFSRDSTSIGWAKLRVEIIKISDKENYSCLIISVLDSSGRKIASEDEKFVISKRNLFKTASFHHQGEKSHATFGELYKPYGAYN